MGLDMYLEKVKRIDDASLDDIRGVEEYFGYMLRPEKYRDSSMEEWCGVPFDRVNLDMAGKYFPEYVHRYSAWDTEKRFGYRTMYQQVGYWRKANHIHNWFVQNVQDGEDNCGSYEVTKEQLEELLDTCEKVKAGLKLVSGKVKNGKRVVNGRWEDIIEDGYYIEDPSVADELLPTTSGCFFGSDSYNQWYLDDVTETIEVLKKVLKETDFDNWIVFYSSSW